MIRALRRSLRRSWRRRTRLSTRVRVTIWAFAVVATLAAVIAGRI